MPAGLDRMPISGVIVRGADAVGVIGAVTVGWAVGATTPGREIAGDEVAAPGSGNVTLPGEVGLGRSSLGSGIGVVADFDSPIPGSEGMTAMLGGAETAVVGMTAVASGRLGTVTGIGTDVAAGGIAAGIDGEGRFTADGGVMGGAAVADPVPDALGMGMGI